MKEMDDWKAGKECDFENLQRFVNFRMADFSMLPDNDLSILGNFLAPIPSLKVSNMFTE